jgi:hypothetical protein
MLCIFFYGEKVKADASSYEKLLDKISKLEVKVGILENEVELKDRLMKYIIAEQIEETKKCTCKCFFFNWVKWLIFYVIAIFSLAYYDIS